MVILATFAVTQSKGISVSPANAGSSGLFEPRGGQISLFAPPYCDRGIICRVLDRAIALYRRLANRFPFLAPIFERAIRALQFLQAQLSGNAIVSARDARRAVRRIN